MEASQVNVAASDYLRNSIAPTAVLGFTHRIERYFRGLEMTPSEKAHTESASYDSARTAALLIIRAYSLNKGFARSVTDNYGTKRELAKAGNPRLLDKLTAEITFDLFITLTPRSLRHGFQNQLESSEKKATFQAFLSHCHFCGGLLKPVAGRQIKVIKKYRELQASLQAIPSHCYAVEDASGLLAQRPAEMDSLQHLLTLIRRRRSPADDDEYRGFLVPLAVGYRLLEEPSHKSATRGDYPHAFCEPLLGLGRLRSVASLRIALKQRSQPLCWWRYAAAGATLVAEGTTLETLDFPEEEI